MNDKGLINFRDIGGLKVPTGVLRPDYFIEAARFPALRQSNRNFCKMTVG